MRLIWKKNSFTKMGYACFHRNGTIQDYNKVFNSVWEIKKSIPNHHVSGRAVLIFFIIFFLIYFFYVFWVYCFLWYGHVC